MLETLTQGGARKDAGPQLLLLAGPGLRFFRPYRALRGTSGILPLDLSKNVQTRRNRFAVLIRGLLIYGALTALMIVCVQFR